MKVINSVRSVGFLLACSAAFAEETPIGEFSPYAAEVAAKTLHVRSGPSTNYYPVARLNAGTRLQVIGEESGWLAVTPPTGSFSLIAAKFVDRGEGPSGTVNADNVRVRAGSDLSPHNYAIQLKLSKGAMVNIQGPMDAEFLKIEPPAGARVWVATEYVKRVGDGSTGAAMPPPAESNSPKATLTGTDIATDPVSAAAGAPPAANAQASAQTPTPDADLPTGDEDGPSSPSSLSTETIETPSSSTPPVTKSEPLVTIDRSSASPTQAPSAPTVEAEGRQEELEALDKQLSEEMAKPLLNRDLTQLLPRYRELAEQGTDEYTQAYARIRVQQVEAAMEMIEGVRTIGRLRDEVHTVRTVSLADRSNIRHVPVRADGGFDVEGELRPSAVFDSPIGPRRFRLVDPRTSPARTIGYVEIPLEAQVDMSNLLSRRVAIRARDRILTPGDVDPLSVYFPSEIVVLEQAADGSTRIASSVNIPPSASTSSAEVTRAERP